MRKYIIAGAAVIALLVTACSGFNDDRGWGDAPARQVEDREVLVWPSPDLFMNVGAFCIGDDAVYIHTREASPVVVGGSKNCDPDGVLYDGKKIESTEMEDPPEEEG